MDQFKKVIQQLVNLDKEEIPNNESKEIYEYFSEDKIRIEVNRFFPILRPFIRDNHFLDKLILLDRAFYSELDKLRSYNFACFLKGVFFAIPYQPFSYLRGVSTLNMFLQNRRNPFIPFAEFIPLKITCFTSLIQFDTESILTYPFQIDEDVIFVEFRVSRIFYLKRQLEYNKDFIKVLPYKMLEFNHSSDLYEPILFILEYNNFIDLVDLFYLISYLFIIDPEEIDKFKIDFESTVKYLIKNHLIRRAGGNWVMSSKLKH
jgi:hypothetical protein